MAMTATRINVRLAKAVRLTVRARAALVKTRRVAATIAAAPTPAAVKAIVLAVRRALKIAVANRLAGTE
jgi:hypothetical protein